MQGFIMAGQRSHWPYLKLWMLLVLLYSLLGCSLQQYPVRLITSADLNANDQQQGLSLVTHIYLLHDVNAFLQLTEQQFVGNASSFNKNIVLYHRKLLLHPNQTKMLYLPRMAHSTAIAVVALFHHPIANAWYAMAPLHQTWFPGLQAKVFYLQQASVQTLTTNGVMNTK